MRNLLKRLGTLGKTIIVSSHILPELADVCNKIGIIDRGVMCVSADVAEVMRQVRQHIVLHIRVAENSPRAVEILRGHPSVAEVDPQPARIHVRLRPGITDYSDLATLLVQGGLRLVSFHEDELNLEAAFMALTNLA